MKAISLFFVTAFLLQEIAATPYFRRSYFIDSPNAVKSAVGDTIIDGYIPYIHDDPVIGIVPAVRSTFKNSPNTVKNEVGNTIVDEYLPEDGFFDDYDGDDDDDRVRPNHSVGSQFYNSPNKVSNSVGNEILRERFSMIEMVPAVRYACK
ncbi:uncharacterized protein [Periplaneta americana]|uniref:uncharacterized protein n=1 Tax=Periplaneta americana TaxID=6978 RepID=UPI0037E8628A